MVFRPAFPASVPEADVTVAESQQPGHTLVTRGGDNAVCTNLHGGSAVPVTDTGTADAPGFTVDVPRLAAVSCVVHNRPPRAADVTVAKEWVIDGVTHTHADRPAGYDAALGLTGPSDEGSTAQDWDVARTGYTVGDSAVITETTTVPDPCVLTGSAVVAANDAVVDAPLPYTARLALEHNAFTVRNTVSCTARLTLDKNVDNRHRGTRRPDAVR